MSAMIVSLLLVGACVGGKPSGAITIRLVDRFNADALEGGAPPSPRGSARAEWRFDDATTQPGAATASDWKAGPGVASVTIREGRLIGRRWRFRRKDLDAFFENAPRQWDFGENDNCEE